MIVADNLSGAELNAVKNNYQVRDLWSKQNIGTTAKNFKAAVAAHDVVVLRLVK